MLTALQTSTILPGTKYAKHLDVSGRFAASRVGVDLIEHAVSSFAGQFPHPGMDTDRV